MYNDHKLVIAPDKLRSNFEDYILEDEVVKLIECYDEEMARFESIVHIQDTVKNPFGLYKITRDYAYKNGQHFDEKNNKIPIEDLLSNNADTKNKANLAIHSYKPNNINEIVIDITDHLGLLTSEKGSDLWHTIDHHSKVYQISKRDRWNYHVVDVQQQVAEQEKQQFTFKGDSVVAKLRPTPDGLANNKETQRNVNLMYGLFAPYRYKISDYEGYNIDKLGDNYREFSVMLNRSGTGFINLDLYFHGACNYFKKLPKSEDMNNETYNRIITINKNAK